MRVLIVDDEIDTLIVLARLVELGGHTTITAQNGKQAMALAETETPDCALLDVMMPGMDGFMLCRMLRLHPSTRNLPIIFVTAYASPDLERKAREAGGDFVLPKPVGRRALAEGIERAHGMHAGM